MNLFHQVELNLNQVELNSNRRRAISSMRLGSVFMVVEGNRDMGLLVADIIVILNWFNSG